MESSRGGPLTTFIMMLPLIVVPAIAMLKPVGKDGGLISELISAATGKSEDLPTVESETAEEADPFEALFSEEPNAPPVNNASTGRQRMPFSDPDVDSLLEDFSTPLPMTPQPVNSGTVPPSTSYDAQTTELLNQLQQMGVSRTLWFSPDSQSVGFVAFFDAGRGIIRYRFESVAVTRAAAVQDVILQAQQWQREQGQGR